MYRHILREGFCLQKRYAERSLSWSVVKNQVVSYSWFATRTYQQEPLQIQNANYVNE